ncbi:MAG: T9SS type A sorting domain-containing protein [Rhodothermaceae bacterium]|nr:T9SS type A sorting domain-containing protein [Rhodothermaceae bacterium]MYC05298.1 T9SS type A sorting domain-containing protein [Rhodothermaceae bacterium]MYI18212.1 T9SS type A sorting domain-containing protein [Rhodothermaceae bacterium]
MRTITTCFGLMIALVFLVTRPAFAQTTIEIEAGQNTLNDALAEAGPGDTIVLTTDGGEYLTDSNINITIPVTIQAAAGLNERPVIKHSEVISTAVIFEVWNSLHLDGVELDGQAGTEYNAKYLLRIRPQNDAGDLVLEPTTVVKVTDSYLHDVIDGGDGNFLRQYAYTLIDSVIFRNSVLSGSGKEGIRIKDESSERKDLGFYNVKYFEVSNTTIANTKRSAIYVYSGDTEPATPEPEFIVDRLTCHNCGSVNGRAIWPRDMQSAVITNSIVANGLVDDELWSVNLAGASSISHSNVFMVSKIQLGGSSTQVEISEIDPQFANPDMLDFTLPADSPLLTMGTDGMGIGDMRWTTSGGSTIQVAAGQNTLADAVDAAEPGDIIELTDSGGEYLNDDRMDITIPLTIRAAAGLDERPVIKNNEADESTRVVFEVLNSLHLDGIEIDGQAGTDFNAKYLLRVRGDVDSSTVIKVTDSYLHDVVAGSDGNFLRQYPGTFADSIIFRNSILSGSGKEGIRTKDEETDSGLFNVKYFEVSNTTMANTRASAIYIYSGDTDPATPEPEVIVDHLTCHNCGHSNGRAIYPRGVQTARITNSIIANSLVDEERWSVNLTGTSSISHSNLFMVSKIELGGNSTQEAISEIDPQFANPDMLDFTLPADSPLLTMGTDGMGIGDMRWITSGVAIEEDTPIPSETNIVLDQNYPNPFNIETTIPYHLGRDGHVTLEVFDLLGRSVARLKDGYDSAGSYSVSLSMQQQGAGTYFYRLTVDGESTWRKLVVVK